MSLKPNQATDQEVIAVVKMAREIGIPKTAQAYKVNYSLVHDWCKKAGVKPKPSVHAPPRRNWTAIKKACEVDDKNLDNAS